MITPKLCAIGILDIELNLIIRENEKKLNNFNLKNFKKIEDLKYLFNNNNFNFIDNISLSTKNNLLNTLLYINRAFKNKTFIELIMLNNLDFSEENYFIKEFIKRILSKNYIYLIENNINSNIKSNIILKIKILKNNNDEVLEQKIFNLIENNFIENYYEKNEDLLNKIKYDFSNTNYFYSNIKELLSLNINYKEIIDFYNNLNDNYSKLKIITCLTQNFYTKQNLINSDFLNLIKEIISLTDILFAEKKTLNLFYSKYNEISNENIFNNDNNEKKSDLILNDSKIKKIFYSNRILILIDNLNIIKIYIQNKNLNIIYSEDFFINSFINYNQNNEMLDILINKYIFLFNIYIGAFLSRLLYGKLFKTCITAGNLILQKTLDIINNKINYITDIELYNVIVPIRKNKKKEENLQLIQNNLNILNKEKNFVLDCTNILNSKIKEYNVIFDKNNDGCLTSKRNFSNLKKNEKFDDLKPFLLNKNKIKKDLADKFSKKNLILHFSRATTAKLNFNRIIQSPNFRRNKNSSILNNNEYDNNNNLILKTNSFRNINSEINKESLNILSNNYNNFNKNKQIIKGFTSNNSLYKYKNNIKIPFNNKRNNNLKECLTYKEENNKINKKLETEKYSCDIFNTDINYLLNNKEYEQINFFSEKSSNKNYFTENKNNKHYKFPNGYIDKKFFENILNKYELKNKKI